MTSKAMDRFVGALVIVLILGLVCPPIFWWWNDYKPDWVLFISAVSLIIFMAG